MFKITKTIYVRPDGKRNILHHEVCVEDLEEYKKKCHPNKGEKVLLEYEDLSNPAPPEPAPVPKEAVKRKGRPPMGKDAKNRAIRVTQGEHLLIKLIRKEKLSDEDEKLLEEYLARHQSVIDEFLKDPS